MSRQPRRIAQTHAAVDAHARIVAAHLERAVSIDTNDQAVVWKYRPAERDIDPAVVEPFHAGRVDDRRHTPAIDRRAANEGRAKSIVARAVARVDRVAGIRRVCVRHRRDDRARHRLARLDDLAPAQVLDLGARVAELGQQFVGVFAQFWRPPLRQRSIGRGDIAGTNDAQVLGRIGR